MGTLVRSGRVESYVLDVASMHASALAFVHRASCEYTSLASRRSASRPHVRLHGPPRATTSRPTDMVAPSSRSHAHRVHRRDDNNGRRQRGAQGLSTGIGTRQLHVHAPWPRHPRHGHSRRSGTNIAADVTTFTAPPSTHNISFVYRLSGLGVGAHHHRRAGGTYSCAAHACTSAGARVSEGARAERGGESRARGRTFCHRKSHCMLPA